ncbi:MAG TPA: bifunctional glutamate N-acetyltransferase/amino-acid acetyltransferase ArgJ [Gemmatimonadaceae bacterium]|nr:bifunctional glutamate N-acetyltransferase/amino-acid acetyltransferase ArgJ [Gemmatimonadaceae bacterium]
MQFDATPRLPRGFRCASRNIGLKPKAPDLAVFASDVDATAAAVFTRNQFPGAPVVLGRETIKSALIRAIVVNSKVSNVATGPDGLDRARRMAAAAAAELDTDAGKVLVSSTGVIGVPLPIEKIEAGLRGLATELQDDPIQGVLGMMTTDTHPKAQSCHVGDATISWVAKGSGMIAPNMATMLVYIFTDAAFDAPTLDRMLRAALHVSFNMLSVDSDTSTSDTCALLANGLAGTVPEADFQHALTAGCIRMAETLARDGEGAEHLIRATVADAASERDARTIAKSLVNSPLVKTMVAGADPNVGRLLMAVGKCFDCVIQPASTDISINGRPVVAHGARAEFDETELRATLKEPTVDLYISLGVGSHTATAFGCDLTQGYVDENAAYYSS